MQKNGASFIQIGRAKGLQSAIKDLYGMQKNAIFLGFAKTIIANRQL
jgi:hypothetical protein